MRGRGVTLLAATVLVLLTAGCVKQESPASSYYLSPQVLGTTSSGESLDTTAPAPQLGVQDATFPRAAFADTPGANQIAVATGATTITRDRALEIGKPAAARTLSSIQLRSAIHVTLPAAFMTAVTKGARTKAAPAWIVTYTGLPGSRDTSATPGTARPSDRTVAIDADTGAVIATVVYPAQ